MITQLQTPIPLETPKGKGMAHLVIDYGIEYDLIWIVFIDETGECWCFRNPEVKLQYNLTFGREKPTVKQENRGFMIRTVPSSYISEDGQAVS